MSEREDTFENCRALNHGRGQCRKCGKRLHGILVWTSRGRESVLVEWDKVAKVWRRHVCPDPPKVKAAA